MPEISITLKEEEIKGNLDDLIFFINNDFTPRFINQLMMIERDEWCGAKRYKHSKNRRSYASGYHDKTVYTETGIHTLRVPEARNIVNDDKVERFYPKILKRYSRSTLEFKKIIRHLIIQGLSTRDISDYIYKTFDGLISPSGVSKILQWFDDEIAIFHKRKFKDKYIFLYFDGLNISSKGNTGANRRVILAAYGVKKDLSEELIDFKICSGETEKNWSLFIEDLSERGLEGKSTYVVLHDGKIGLENAISLHYPWSINQNCIFHKMQNVAADVKDKIKNKKKILRELSDLYKESENITDFKAKFKSFTNTWKKIEPKAVNTARRNIEKTIQYFRFLDIIDEIDDIKDNEKKEFREKIVKYIRTNNKIERYFKEIRRRTKLIEGFENDKSIERFFYNIVKFNQLRKEVPL